MHAALAAGLLALGGASYASDPPAPATEAAQPERDSKAKEQRPRSTPKCPEGGGSHHPEKRSRFAPLSPLVA